LIENKIFEIQKKSNEFKKEPLISYSKSQRNRIRIKLLDQFIKLI